MSRRSLLVAVLLDPTGAAGLSVGDWDLLIRQARVSNLLARLQDVLERADLIDRAPPAARMHLQSACRIAERQRQRVQWEIDCVADAVASAAPVCILLKGAAYLALDLPLAKSRIYADVDVLVHKEAIGKVESALIMNGWVSEPMSAYDDHYYRTWMHELPPFRHRRRDTVLDLHHTILPETARIRVNTPALFDGVVEAPSCRRLFVLQPADLLLHSATHLFHEGEFANGLRDLFDLDGLIRHFSAAPRFWEQVSSRAAELGLERPLFYALRYAVRVLETPIPPEVIDSAARAAPVRSVRAVMDFCYSHAFQPIHPSCDSRTARMARLLLYVRSHWIRMPLHLLVYHLSRKAIRRLSGASRREQETAQRHA